jgi:hypothetical protein
MKIERLVEEFSARLAIGSGSLFIGSGISVPSGLPNWIALLNEPADDLGLKITENENLPLVAQFLVNHYGGNRGVLIQRLRDIFGKRLLQNSYHRAISDMNVSSIWTTNYDSLLEDALPHFFVRSNDSQISHPGIGGDLEIIKMHGCIKNSPPEDIVITSEDYEDYFVRRPATSSRLEMDLVRRSFLFIGYGYGDPNVGNIFTEARRLSKKALGHHYMIQIMETDPQRQIRQELFVREMGRIGINCSLVESYRILEESLVKISLRSRGSTVFATGGHRSDSGLAKNCGKALASIPGLVLLDGQSTGAGHNVKSEFSHECLIRNQDIMDRLRIFSNPYAIRPEFENDLTLLPELKAWRSPLLKSAQIVIVFDGSNGTEAEVQVAVENGCKILPVPDSLTGLPLRLLKDSTVADLLKSAAPDYYEKAILGAVDADDVKVCVTKLLNI